MELDWQRLTREVQRVHTRYHREVIEAFALCPWAKEARERARVHMNVTFMTSADPRHALQLIDDSMGDPAIEIGMLIFPLLALDRLPFEHFVADIRALDGQRSALGEQRVALAAFHPHAPADASTPARLVPFLRRSPDPMIQAVRTQTLDRVRQTDDHGTRFLDLATLDLAVLAAQTAVMAPLAARIAEHNARTVQRIGLARIEAILEDIQADRTRSYGELGVPSSGQAALAHGPGGREPRSLRSGSQGHRRE